MEGLTRKQVVKDNLEGAAAQPVTISSGGVRSPAAPAMPNTSFSEQINQQVGSFVGGQLQKAVKLKQERDYMDGQMAFQQGKAFEDVEMSGNKWALEGYRVVQAQTLSSGLLTAQESEINSGGYEMSPEEYRAQFIDRTEKLIAASPDGRTGELVRKQLMSQMPVLVQGHTKAHLEWKEKQNFQNLETSVDVISRDVTASKELINFAKGGAGSATEGLSDDRRKSAVLSGVIRAFDNDNPLAFATLSREGLLNADNMTGQQINSLRAARKRFENRRRSEYDKELFDAEQNLMKRVTEGELSPTDAAEALSTLYADHNIEVTKAEIGAIYTTAQDGVRTKKLTEATLLEDAQLRGDKNTYADIIINSLSGTESGGNFSAQNRIKDGRRHGGRLQFGQARLNEFAKVLGVGSISMDNFIKDKNLQRMAERWHVNDTLRSIKNSGYDQLVGKKINGVEVTVSGMVAVAHLGGFGGLQKFVSSGGKYNPSDEYGTSLTDYLRKHAIGSKQEMFTPQDRLADARQRLEYTRKRVAMDAYERFAPAVNELDTAFQNNDLTRVQWQQQRQELFNQYQQQRTKADVDQEVTLANTVSAALQNKQNTEKQIAAGIQLEQATQQFNKVFDAFSNGDVIEINGAERRVNRQDLMTAQDAFVRTRQSIQQEYGIARNADDEVNTYKGIIQKLDTAIAKRTEFDANTALIRQAEASGTLDQSAPNLQKRAVREYEQAQLKQYTDAVAAGKMSPEDAQAAMSKDMLSYFGKTGLVDQNTKQVMNGFLQQDWIVDGKPNPNVVDAISNIRTITDINPALLEKYIPDDETRALVQTALNRSAGGPIESAVFSTRNNKDKPTQIRDNSDVLNTEAVEKSLRTWSANAADNTQVQVWGDFLQPKAEFGGSHFSDDTGALTAIFSDKADLSQIGDRTSREFTRLMNPDGDAQTLMREEVKTEARRLMTEHAGVMSTEEALVQAQQTIQTRGAFIGGDFVLFPKGESVVDAIFGGEAKNVDVVDATNRAIMDYLRTEDMQKSYPYLAKTRSWSDWWNGNIPLGETISGGTGVRPFRANVVPTANGPALQLHVLDEFGGYTNPVLLSREDLRKAGMNLVNKLRD